MFVAFAPDAQFQPFGQSIDDRHADAMKTAGNLVGVLVEFSTGVQLGHDHFGGRNALLGMNANRNSATIVSNRNRVVAVQNHADRIAITGQSLVNAVVDHFIDHMVQARAIIGIADIHARTLANSL